MLLPGAIVDTRTVAAADMTDAATTPAVARVLPSLTDVAFLMPLFFIFAKLNGARTLLGDGDTGWHVRTGEWILAHHQVPRTDLFSFSRPGAPWFAWEWLWDVAFAMLHQRWGMAAVVAASVMVICLTTALLFRLVRRKCGNGLVAIAVTLLATGGCAIHWLARPHLFTQLFLVVTLHLTERAREGRTRLLAWLVPLTLLWTNVHGGFFVIFLVLGCYIASDLLNAAVGPGPFERASLRAIRPWVITFFACLAVTFVNPYGWQLHRHIVEYLRDPYQFQHISELQSINFHSPVVPYFEPLLALALAAAVWDARHRRFADSLLSLGWLHLALIAQRNLPLFAIVASPMAARGVCASIAWLRRSAGFAAWIGCAAAWFEQSSAGFEKTDRIGRIHLASALPLTAVAAILLLTPPAPGAVDSRFTSTYDPKSYPEQALVPLRDPAIHHIFADDEWGDYLIYRLYPAKKVFVDGRSDFYGDAFGQRYLDLMDVLPGWQKTLDRYDVDAIVLSPRRALAAVLKISRDWRVTYDDGVSVVFRRNPREPNSLVTSDERKNRDRAITIPINGDHAITQPNT